MNNRELYKKTFSNLHASDSLDLEVMKMKKSVKGPRCRKSLLVATMILALVFAMSCITYAATDGQIVDDIKVFFGGESYEVETIEHPDMIEFKIKDK